MPAGASFGCCLETKLLVILLKMPDATSHVAGAFDLNEPVGDFDSPCEPKTAALSSGGHSCLLSSIG
eukprot:3307150-Prymnesium_polylepis.1